MPFPNRARRESWDGGRSCRALLGWTDECVRPSVSTGGPQVHDLFRNCEDTGFAGDDEEAVRGIAPEPARPLQAARIDRPIKAVPGQ